MALARISELGVQKYTFGVNWVSNSFPSHCIIHKISGCPKSAIGRPISTWHWDTPLAKRERACVLHTFSKLVQNIYIYHNMQKFSIFKQLIVDSSKMLLIICGQSTGVVYKCTTLTHDWLMWTTSTSTLSESRSHENLPHDYQRWGNTLTFDDWWERPFSGYSDHSVVNRQLMQNILLLVLP